MTGSTIISAQVPSVMRDQLAKLAAESDRSLSAELRRSIGLYLLYETRSQEPKA
jgi:hypothetical protein